MQDNTTTDSTKRLRGFNLTGQIFGRLTVIKVGKKKSGRHRYWLCRCECGTLKEVIQPNLRGHATVSCGCFGKTQHITHGKTNTPEHSVWLGMKRRCYDSRVKGYKYYGARGIRMSDEWFDFAVFYADMGPRPSKHHSIERVNNDGNYCKENCIWATIAQQAANQRGRRWLTLNGETKLIAHWARQLGVSIGGIKYRLQRGFTEEEALSMPFGTQRLKSPSQRPPSPSHTP